MMYNIHCIVQRGKRNLEKQCIQKSVSREKAIRTKEAYENYEYPLATHLKILLTPCAESFGPLLLKCRT